jgi:hypothetical protein
LPSIESLVIDTGFGKKSCFIDLEETEDKLKLVDLIKQSDIFSQAYRPGSLAERGFSPVELAKLRPGIICVELSAYGHAGPWATRRGYDSLVQSVTGLAYEQAGGLPPKHLPAQALDYISGYLGALAAMIALQRRAKEGGSYLIKLSLAQTGRWLSNLGRYKEPERMHLITPKAKDIPEYFETHHSDFGLVEHFSPVAELSVTPARWRLPVVKLGSHAAKWD